MTNANNSYYFKIPDDFSGVIKINDMHEKSIYSFLEGAINSFNSVPDCEVHFWLIISW